MLVARQDEVDIEPRELGEHVSRVGDDVALTAGPRDRYEMVMDREDLDILRLVQLLSYPRIAFLADVSFVEVGLGRVDTDDRDPRRMQSFGAFGLECLPVAGAPFPE